MTRYNNMFYLYALRFLWLKFLGILKRKQTKEIMCFCSLSWFVWMTLMVYLNNFFSFSLNDFWKIYSVLWKMQHGRLMEYLSCHIFTICIHVPSSTILICFLNKWCSVRKEVEFKIKISVQGIRNKS